MGRRLDATLLGLALLAVLAFAGGWIYSIYAQNPELVRTMTQLTYCLGVVAAFMAPPTGSRARSTMERHPLFGESLATPLPHFSYIAALHGRVLVRMGLAAAIAATAVAGYGWIMLTGGKELAGDLRLSLLWPLLNAYDYFGMVDEALGWRVWYTIAIGFCGLNLVSGFYLRAALLAEHSQLSPAASFEGGVLTAILIFAAVASLLARIVVAGVFPYGAWFDPFPREFTLPLLVILMEGGLAVGRFVVARKTWGKIGWRGIEESRRLLFDPK